ncbi:hypothetical protein L1987_28057 [Smallanthus sonchifolius]|uniref:Uncharacterized protein n=1 Tax=Smallanthus sonchifolius TaxID=185202 RepID=A0ACB9IC47_9ASTR|nr:hypothetical protein L1987_28057 [Smallanthus sonchifolius]
MTKRLLSSRKKIRDLNWLNLIQSQIRGDGFRGRNFCNVADEVDANEDNHDVGPSSPFSDNADKVEADYTGPSSHSGETILSPHGSPIQKINSKMTKAELERDGLIFYLKDNNHKSKQLKNMKTENLKKLVNDVKTEKEKGKDFRKRKGIRKRTSTIKKKEVVKEKELVKEEEKELEKQKEKEKRKEVVSDFHKANFPEDEEKKLEENKAFRRRLKEIELSKKRRYDVYTSGFNTQKSLLEARIRELDARKLKLNVNVEKVYKEIYSTNTAEASVDVSAESKATWFKK